MLWTEEGFTVECEAHMRKRPAPSFLMGPAARLVVRFAASTNDRSFLSGSLNRAATTGCRLSSLAASAAANHW